MSTLKYHEKLAEALTARVGNSVSVWTDSSGLVVLDEDGTNARAMTRVYDVDRRSTPTAGLVDDTIERAARALSADIPKYKPEYVEPARAFVARLRSLVQTEAASL